MPKLRVGMPPGVRHAYSRPDKSGLVKACHPTRREVTEAGFVIKYGEILEHGGEKHYWIIAKKKKA